MIEPVPKSIGDRCINRLGAPFVWPRPIGRPHETPTRKERGDVRSIAVDLGEYGAKGPRHRGVSLVIEKRKFKPLNGDNTARPKSLPHKLIKFDRVKPADLGIFYHIDQVDNDYVVQILVLLEKRPPVTEDQAASRVVERAHMERLKMLPAQIDQLTIKIDHGGRPNALMDQNLAKVAPSPPPSIRTSFGDG
jgi:hypothetical protein